MHDSDDHSTSGNSDSTGGNNSANDSARNSHNHNADADADADADANTNTNRSAPWYEHIEFTEGKLRVTRAGFEGPPVLLLSGGGVDSAKLSWSRLLPALSAHHRVYALDWPKQGGSKPWNGIADHARLQECVLSVLDRYDLDQTDVVGLSQGGALALATAIDHPDRVRRLVAIAPAGILGPYPPIMHQLYWLMARIPFLSDTLPSRVFRKRETTAWFLRRYLFAGPVDDFDSIVDECMTEMADGASTSDWQRTGITFTGMAVDLRPRLSQITCPTLFIQGDRDAGVRPKFTRQAAAAVPGARLEIIEGAGHWPAREQPEVVNRLITDFLD